MKLLLKHIYILILAYTAYIGYELWGEKEIELANEINVLDQIVAKVKEKEEELKLLEAYYKDVDLAIENIKLVMLQVKDLQSKLPSKNDDLTNLQTIKNIGSQINMQSMELSSAKEEQRDFYFVTRYNLKAAGTYLQFLLLLEQISKGQRLLNIPAIELKEKATKQKGRYVLVDGNVTIESYRYNAKYEESDDVVGDILNKYSDIIERRNRQNKQNNRIKNNNVDEKIEEATREE